MVILGRSKGSVAKGGEWKVAELVQRRTVASDVMSLTFSVEGWRPHIPGQHYEIALTALDGYRAVRNYSVASEPEKVGFLEFGVQLVPDGEVSPYLYEMEVGEKVEMRGPLGGYFNWDVYVPGSLILVGGGSGVIPLMSMIRHNGRHGNVKKVALALSAKTVDRIPYKTELDDYKINGSLRLLYAVTQQKVEGERYHKGRLDMFVLKDFLGNFLEEMPMIHICGPNAFVESVSDDLLAIGFNSHSMKTERFG